MNFSLVIGGCFRDDVDSNSLSAQNFARLGHLYLLRPQIVSIGVSQLVMPLD
jgi:hypothetical protein